MKSVQFVKTVINMTHYCLINMNGVLRSQITLISSYKKQRATANRKRTLLYFYQLLNNKNLLNNLLWNNYSFLRVL